MTTTEAIRLSTVNELFSMLDRLELVPGDVAAHYRRDGWSCIADLELGCRCEEVAHTLALSAEHWLQVPW